MASGWTITSARAMNFSASPHEHRIREGAEAIGSDNDKPAGSGHALAIIVPTAIVRPAVASAMLMPKLIADAGDNASLRLLDFQHPQPEHSRRLRRRRPRRSRR